MACCESHLVVLVRAGANKDLLIERSDDRRRRWSGINSGTLSVRHGCEQYLSERSRVRVNANTIAAQSSRFLAPCRNQDE